MIKMEIIDIKSEIYSDRLREIKDPPDRLYCMGDLQLMKEDMIAVVGTRRSSPYGRWAASRIAEKIAACGVPVVSGMAEGIDSCAHRGCLEGGSKTVAVLGTGIDICYPKSNLDLYRTIIERGLIISEYPPGDRGRPYYFPRRNRIISGLAKSVVVVEGAFKSGSMITAGLALEQGRDVFAVPGNINQPNSTGVNKLIADGAYPILDLESIPQVLGIQSCLSKKLRNLSFTDDEKSVIAAIYEAPGSTRDYAALETGLDVLTVSMLLSALTLKGIVDERDGRFYIA